MLTKSRRRTSNFAGPSSRFYVAHITNNRHIKFTSDSVSHRGGRLQLNQIKNPHRSEGFPTKEEDY